MSYELRLKLLHLFLHLTFSTRNYDYNSEVSQYMVQQGSLVFLPLWH